MGAGRAAPLADDLRFTPRILATYLPWYTPHRIPLPEVARERLAHYGARAL